MQWVWRAAADTFDTLPVLLALREKKTAILGFRPAISCMFPFVDTFNCKQPQAQRNGNNCGRPSPYNDADLN